MGHLIQVFIVVDFEPLRVGLASTLSKAPDMQLVGQASSVEEMVSRDEYHAAEILVIDAQVANRTGLREALDQLQERLPAVKVIFLANPEDARFLSFEDIASAMRLHTVGVLFKDGPVARLIEAIRVVMSGAFVCETAFIKDAFDRVSRWVSHSGDEQIEHLSEREKEVLNLVALGRSNKEIARELFLAEGTVKAHISHIMAKLDLERRTDLVRFALVKGLVPLQEE